MIGELLDHYRVLELIGRGAMGVVYKALDVNLDRQVAIKVMSAEARNDPDFVERFRQEARLQGALNHPNVAMLFDYFIHDGAPVAVMELIDGESLEQLIRRRGAIPVRESIPIFKQALRGVAAAHRAGIVHRDLKPSNLMVTRDDVVKVMDFGIAKRQGAPGATKVSSTSIGSPLYMAPEQILGRAVDRRTDVYALGLTLYELVSGHKPFNPRGKAEYMVLNAHVNDLPEPPTVYRFGLPQPIVDAVMRSLAKDPAARFQSAEEFMAALPDAPAATAANAPERGPTAANAAAPRLGPTGTVALTKSPPMAAAPTGTVALAKPPAMAAGPTDTVAFEYGSTTRRDPDEGMTFDFGASTVLLQEEEARRSAPTMNSPPPSPALSPATAGPRGAPPSLGQRLRAHRLSAGAALVATLVVGALTAIPRMERRHAALEDAALASGTPDVTQAPASTATPPPPPPTETAAPTPADTSPAAAATAAPSADATDSTAAATRTATLPPTVTPPRPDLSGIWRGEYVDASGRPLLRVVNLSISHVYDDGGIEGTLRYQAASGDGECRLHPRGSNYSAPERRLQLSPEGCSAHYPRELGVPLDFDGVNPRTNMLRNGRIEAPTGASIRVRLKRVGGL